MFFARVEACLAQMPSHCTTWPIRKADWYILNDIRQNADPARIFKGSRRSKSKKAPAPLSFNRTRIGVFRSAVPPSLFRPTARKRSVKTRPVFSRPKLKRTGLSHARQGLDQKPCISPRVWRVSCRRGHGVRSSRDHPPPVPSPRSASRILPDECRSRRSLRHRAAPALPGDGGGVAPPPPPAPRHELLVTGVKPPSECFLR